MATINPSSSEGIPSHQPLPLPTSNESSQAINKCADKALQRLVMSLAVCVLVAAVTIALTTNVAAIAIIAIVVASAALLVLISTVWPESETTRVCMNYIKASIVELGAILLMVATYVVPGTWFDPKGEQAAPEKTPIILVHGYLHNSSATHYLRYRLSKAGLGPIYTVNLGGGILFNPFHPLEHYAEVLKDKVAEVCRQTGATKVNLVGHSMGGVISSMVAQDAQAKGQINKVVTIGSPLQGTTVARIGIGECARQMMKDSATMVEFNKKFDECNPHTFYHIGSKTDMIIRPTNSAVRSMIGARGEFSYEFEWMGHATYLWSPETADIVIEQMQKPPVVPPTSEPQV
jgi:triacylglycerol lipase